MLFIACSDKESERDMVTTTIRRLEYHDRFALQQADQAIRKNVVRALVELITNSNDSAYRLETEGNHIKGTIIVEITRKRRNSILCLGDFAHEMHTYFVGSHYRR